MKSSNKSNSNKKRSSSKSNTGSKKRISVPDLDADRKLKEKKSQEELKRLVEKRTYELEQSQKRFAGILQIAGDAIISIDEKYSIQLFNAEAEKIFGYKAKEVIGKSINLVIPDRFVKDHNQHIKSFKNSKVSSKKMGERIQVFGLKKDGSEFPAEASISKFIAKDSVVFTVVVRDITQRILSERKLKDITTDLQVSQQMLQTVMDTIPVRVFWKNLNLEYLGCNKLFAKDAGLNSPEEIVGKNDFQLTWKEQAELYRANDSQVIDSGKSKLNYEELLTTSDGNKIWLRQSKVPLINQNGKLIGVLGTYEDVTDLKKVEEEKEKLVSIVEANTDFIGLADLKGQVLYVNNAGKKLVGINSNEEIESMNIVEFYSKNDQITLMEEILPDLMEKGNWKGEYQLRHFKTGKSIPVEMVAFRIDDTKTGQPLAIANISRDITERTKLEREKERVGLELRQFIETANVPIFGIDVDGNINEWNETAERIFGYTKDDVMGRDLVKEFITADYKESVKSVLDDGLKGKETSNYEIPLYTKKDERRVLILLNATTRRDIDGNVTGVMGVGQDITELDEYRKKLEQMVEDRTKKLYRSLTDTEETRDRIDGILKSIGDGLIVTDMHNRVILMNRASENLLGVRFSEVINRPIDYAIKDQTLRERMKSTLEKQETGYEFDFEMPGENEQRLRIMRARTSVIADKAGDKTGIITIIHDVTHEREVDRMKTEFISTAAHELRTPLTSIQGFSEILMTRKNLKNEDKDKYLGYINKQAVGLAAIINDLLDISRIESGEGFSLNRVWCKTGEAIPGAVEMFKEKTDIENFTFSIELPEEDAEIFVDKDKMGQVLINILSNAVKYSPNGGKIVVKGEVAEDEYVISVRDEGIGMTKEQVSHIFDKFYRADATDSAVEGTGLGMSIVKHIVDAHQGRIWIKSKPGKGTGVYIALPRQSDI